MKPGESRAVFVWAAFVILVVLIALWIMSGSVPLESEPDVTISGELRPGRPALRGQRRVHNTFPYHAEVRASALWTLANGAVEQEKVTLVPPGSQRRVSFGLPATREQAGAYRSCELEVRVLRTIGERSP